ncbi:MAG: 4-hydroxythreonine-4-phosphate dehydrogenase PdxA [Bacteroidales bacterium]|nr:4-hydroxythreonine-4-phosphate dehydrogenase PdxA [Bacteroidales bacterium]
MTRKIVIGITQGDTNGIGYEVIIKALSDARILEMCTPVVYGSSKAFGLYRKDIPETENINTNVISSAKDAHPKRVNIVNCVPDELQIDPGQCTHDGAKAAIIALEKAVGEIKAGYLDAIVTAPFNKRSVNEETFKYAGHTEYLISEFEAKDGLMFLCSDKMRVGVATGHLALSKVSGALNPELIVSKLKIMNESLLKDFNIVKPKLAVLGLNPHSGDRGLMGDEELNIISPAIKMANEAGVMAYGPYPPDGFFSVNMQYKFDAVLAMYHDQGLIPFKSLAFDSGVNFTAGLPIVRTSPDHGTAYDLAGENKANPQSMISSIYLAIDVVRNRERYAQMHANPLKIKEFETQQKEKPGKPVIA